MDGWSPRAGHALHPFYLMLSVYRPLEGRRAGFTITELVVVIAIAGILAAIALPRLVGRDTFESRGFYDLAVAVVRYAHKTAVAWRRPIFVCVAATSISAGAGAGCASPITNPTTGAALVANAPGGVTLSPIGNFSFDGLGRPSAGTTVTVTSTIPDDPARLIVVEQETGYVHP